VWFAFVGVLLATAAFVPIRIVYKQNQDVVTMPDGVTIANFAFHPQVLTVAAGTKVTFTNTDGSVHTATASDRSFDSGRLVQGATFTAKITKSTKYYCSIHQYMTAEIKVSG
jgi:plastocyanin